jgi:hypothetical protein
MCDHDIYAKNLATNVTYNVAIGPYDQSHPAIGGNRFAWIEMNKQANTLQLISKSTSDPALQGTVNATLALTSGVTFQRPVLSGEYMVWAEVTSSTGSSNLRRKTAVLKAYNFATFTATTIVSNVSPQVEYAIADRRLVWSDHQLHLYDLSTNASSIIYGGDTRSPAISGDVVVWSQKSTPDAKDFDIWGMKLIDRKAVPLVVAPGTQALPAIVGDMLTWQNDGGAQDGLITTTPLILAFANTPPLPTPPPVFSTPVGTPIQTAPLAAHPLVKGINAATGNAWGGPATDALGADQNSPYFGSVVVLNSDFTLSSGRSAPWGPSVGHAMSNLASQDVRVTVRTYPSLKVAPSPEPMVSTQELAQQVVDTLTPNSNGDQRDWITDLQVNNEPNLEWGEPTCTNCRYYHPPTNATNVYTWDDPQKDYRLYQAVNDFYKDGYNYIIGVRDTCDTSDPACAHLQNIRIWSPPLGECYCHMYTGLTAYAYLYDMIYTYNRLSYHVYSAPNKSDGAGGISNNTWDEDFNNIMRDDINSGRLPSEITEWGWNPGLMSQCNYDQHSTWPANGPLPQCATADGQPHTFESDISRFFANPNQLHHAENVNIWLIKRGTGADADQRADGLDSNNNKYQWFSSYQQSSP